MEWIPRKLLMCLVTAVAFFSVVFSSSRLFGETYYQLSADAKPQETSDLPTSGALFKDNSLRCDDSGCNRILYCDKNQYCFGGWLQGGIMANSRGWTGQNPLPGNVGQVTTGNTDPVLNQAWIFGEKQIDKNKCGFDWGWRVDFAYGSDMPGYQTFNDIGVLESPSYHNPHSFDYGWMTGGGLNPNTMETSILYGAAMPQLYGEVKYNRLSAKFGRFLSPLDYESIMAVSDRNYFYSHSYAFNYLSPNTMVGAIAEYELNRQWTLVGGWTNGWDCGFGFGNRDGSAILGGIKTKPNANLGLSYMISVGDIYRQILPAMTPVPLNMSGFYQTLILDWKVNSRLNYGFDAAYGNDNYKLGVGPNVEFRQKSWSVANYLNYRWNCRWSTALRFEYADMNDGVPIVMNPLTNSFVQSHFGPTAPLGDVYSVTLGATWKPFASERLAVRPEIRYDWFNTPVGTEDLLSAGTGVTWSF